MISEEGAWFDPLEKERASLGIGVQQSHRTVPIPQRKGVRFVASLVIDEAHLQNDTSPIHALGRDDKAHTATLERWADGQLPLRPKLLDHPRECLQPGPSGFSVGREVHANHLVGNREIGHIRPEAHATSFRSSSARKDPRFRS
jgi:hypothetical protein